MNTKKQALEMFIMMTIVKTVALAIPMGLIGMLISTIGWSVPAVGAIALILGGAVLSVYMDFEEYEAAIENVDDQEEES